jgi:hypothetical protein
LDAYWLIESEDGFADECRAGWYILTVIAAI